MTSMCQFCCLVLVLLTHLYETTQLLDTPLYELNLRGRASILQKIITSTPMPGGIGCVREGDYNVKYLDGVAATSTSDPYTLRSTLSRYVQLSEEISNGDHTLKRPPVICVKAFKVQSGSHL